MNLFLVSPSLWCTTADNQCGSANVRKYPNSFVYILYTLPIYACILHLHFLLFLNCIMAPIFLKPTNCVCFFFFGTLKMNIQETSISQRLCFIKQSSFLVYSISAARMMCITVASLHFAVNFSVYDYNITCWTFQKLWRESILDIFMRNCCRRIITVLYDACLVGLKSVGGLYLKWKPLAILFWCSLSSSSFPCPSLPW